ncbi:putative membrane protein [Peptoniphilus sp. ING2-D1G]|nr:putative membrane protein [Peptoniphilus sp. ING2-D1G]
MSRKKKKQITLRDIKKIELTEEEKNIAKKKSILTILLCILWPVTLFMLWPGARNAFGNLYFLIAAISILNVAMTYLYLNLEISRDKYISYTFNSGIGKIERIAMLFLIVEVVFILLYIFVLN